MRARSSRRVRAAAALVALAAVAAACAPRTSGPIAPQPRIDNPGPRPTLSVNATFLPANRPWDIAFDTRGARNLLFTENNTGLVRSNRGLAVDVKPMLGAAFYNTSEAGLMGLAFNPSGTAVSVCATTTVDNRVVRFAVTRDGNGNVTNLSAPAAILTGMAKNDVHNGCRVRFQPGTSPPALWVTMGDAAVGSNPQNPNSPNGKILRITESGAAYPDNRSGRVWYSRGHRNPQGITFGTDRNRPYTAEHGPNLDDEVNTLLNAGNGGWDPVGGGGYNQSVPMTDIAKFPGAIRPLWRSGSPTNGVTFAPSGLTFVHGPQWRSWSGSLVVAFLKNMELRVLFVNRFGFVYAQHIVPESHRGVRLRVPVQGPDGALYVATDQEPGFIWRVIAS